MDPAILIVGTPARRATLSERIVALGYRVRECGLAELGQSVQEGEPPSAIMLCAEGPQAARVMSELRRTRRGLSIPVTLCGRLGGAIRDLADVLDLGADQFLEEPVEASMLGATLLTLAGPASGGPHETHVVDPPTLVESRDGALASDVSLGGISDGGGVTRTATRAQSSASASLGDTLDRLGARLREARGPEPSDSSDDMELSLLDLDAPSDEGGALNALPDPAQSRPDMLLTAITPPPGAARAGTERLGLGRNATVQVPAPPASRRRTADPAERGRRAETEEGAVAEEAVPNLVWRLHEARATGRLELHAGGERSGLTLWWEAGDVVEAQSNADELQLDAVMLRRGLVPQAEHARVVALLARDPGGGDLVTEGWVKPAELPELHRARVRDSLVSAFGWEDGAWRWTPGERHEAPIRLRRPLHRILVDGVRTGVEASILRSRLPSRAQPRCVNSVALSTLDLGFSADTLRWIRALGGEHTLTAAVREGGPPRETALAYLYALGVLGIVAWDDEVQRGASLQTSTGPTAAAVDRARIQERLRLVREADYFAILGLERDAMSVDVQQAHAALQETFALEQLEPEIPAEWGAELDEIRLALDDAYAVLKDDELRLAYLAHLGTP